MSILEKAEILILTFLVLALGPAPAVFSMDTPDIVTLNSLSKIYTGVTFDHTMHQEVEDCAACHHHTTGTPPQEQRCSKCHQGAAESAVVSCQGCHPADPFSAEYLKAKQVDTHRYHTDQLGLKGAYHQSCTGCHQSMGGPTGCLDCHQRSAAGDEFYHAGAFAPQGAPSSKH